MKKQNFGKYILEEPLGEGGMARVYRGRQKNLFGIEKRVAIKIMQREYSENKKMIDMFQHEASLAVQFNHNCVLGIIDYGILEGQCFVVMEHIEGCNLLEFRNRALRDFDGLSIPEIMYLAKNISSGLDYVHRLKDQKTKKPLNLVHRDISPHNIMVSYEGDVKIIDFGVAKTNDSLERSFHSAEAGKLRYMSPEQIRREEATQKSDIYSLGITIWELISGTRIFEDLSQADIVSAINNFVLPDLKSIRPDCPDYLINILKKATQLNPADRYNSAADFHRDISLMLNMHYPSYTQEDFRLKIEWIFKNDRTQVKDHEAENTVVAKDPPTEKSVTGGFKILGEVTTTRNVTVNINLRYLFYLTVAFGLYQYHVSQDGKSSTSLVDYSPALMETFKDYLNTGGTAGAKTQETPSPRKKPVQADYRYITVDTEPKGASLILNNQLSRRVTPTQLQVSNYDEYVLQIKKDGYKTETVAISKSTSQVFLRLTPLPK